MNVDTFLAHHGIVENPFDAEEARHDPVYERIIAETKLTHPSFPKILGRISRPSTSVVFGEKGSGKTAIRLLIGRKVAEHNQGLSDDRVLLIAYDDFNPVLDQLIQRNRPGTSVHSLTDKNLKKVLDSIRLEDHQDAILSLAITRLNDAVLGEEREGVDPVLLPAEVDKVIKKLPRQTRVDWAVLTALYDQPRSGALMDRWDRMRSKLKLGWVWPISPLRAIALVLTVLALAAWVIPPIVGVFKSDPPDSPWLMPAMYVCGIGALILWAIWLWGHYKVWALARRLRRETPAITRETKQMHYMLNTMRPSDLIDQPWPAYGPDDHNSRYELTAKLMDVLDAMGHSGVIVLVDRVDEPRVVSGQAERMQAIIWPMFDNKFLQQDRVGFKLLLPIELRHMVHKESAEFFQEARFDKQSLIDRLEWSGAMLYDLCSARLRACSKGDADALYLTDLFDEDVTQEMIVDALDQMHQPRDAFKFLYQVIQNHCAMVPEDHPRFTVPRLTLETVRKTQAQRVQELYRGLSPA